MSVPSSSPPPAEQTTASESGATPATVVAAAREDLTPAWTDGFDPRPVTLATQEVRLAPTFTGGVSLAVWMGGVARELDLLVQASDRRRVLTDADQDRTEPPVVIPDDHRLRQLYRQLLDLVDVQVAVDVLAGTSAGGINAALLGLVNARSADLSQLRDIWLDAGDIGRLLRDPREKAPPSLLHGDQQMLTALNDGITKIIGHRDAPNPRRTDVYITTTLLSPEISRFSDDYGTQIGDADHHAMFHFDQTALASPPESITAPLALAARSSASFPGAFEPSFLPYGRGTGPLNPDMSPYLNTTRPHWAADGGLLVNRPIAPVLQSIFDRAADRQVRRVLLYVVPTTAPAATPAPDDPGTPLGLAAAMKLDLAATQDQSIASDLAAIREHNDRVRAAADARRRLADLGARLPGGELIADAGAWADYRRRQAEWLVDPLITEISRQTSADRPVATGVDRDGRMRAAAMAAVTEQWDPTETDVLRRATALGRPAFDGAKATVLRLLRLGFLLCPDVQGRYRLSRWAMRVNRQLGDSRQSIESFVRTHLIESGRALQPPDLAARLARELVAEQGSGEALTTAWEALRSVVAEATPELAPLIAAAEAGKNDAPGSLTRRQAEAGEELGCYLKLLDGRDPVLVLLDLHVALRAMQPVLQEVEQPVELIQVSADTRSRLAPGHPTAARKLTGLQFHHFGAFYKRSWRVNDWMWGRLDGCGWLVHMLLDPRRIRTVLETDPGATLGRSGFVQRLEATFGGTVPAAARRELAYLDDPARPMPVSLPELSLWLAGIFQQTIVAEELPILADELRADSPGPRTGTASRTWLRSFDQWKADGWKETELAGLLDGCPVATETLANEAQTRTPLFVRTVTKAAAVATAAGTGYRNPPRSLRPTFGAARSVTMTAYLAAQGTSGRLGGMVAVGLGLLAGGLLGMLTNLTLLGISGLVAFVAGALVLAISMGRKAIAAAGTLAALAVVLLGAAPWLPWLSDRIFPGLSHLIMGMHDHPWTWPLVLFLVVLPPLTLLADAARSSGRRIAALARRWRTQIHSQLAGTPEAPALPPKDGGLSVKPTTDSVEKPRKRQTSRMK